MVSRHGRWNGRPMSKTESRNSHSATPLHSGFGAVSGLMHRSRFGKCGAFNPHVGLVTEHHKVDLRSLSTFLQSWAH
jgi:hypothetical protein